MKKREYRGLCSTCEGRTACTYPHYGDRPTLFCEDFDWLWQHQLATATPLKLTGRAFERLMAAAGQTAPQHKGLCTICENQTVCAFPKQIDGVWHCEEFA